MALTEENKTAIAAQVSEIKEGVEEIKQLILGSLSIQNVGGGHVFNLSVNLTKKIEALEKSVNDLTV
ncbi:hypothetical protein ACK8P5_26025 (plasmid) [Paenibacillus sp. EC2-1]|uniref:hypothetical protein n=1 Tax=Paenibacillus sp. EC2-1 TaxID=3388665 RepID=UPI003BEF0961